MATEVSSQVQAIIIDKLGVDPSRVISQAKLREDLEADSLDLIELTMAIEQSFGIEVSDVEAQKVTTVGDAINLTEKLVKKLEDEKKPYWGTGPWDL